MDYLVELFYLVIFLNLFEYISFLIIFVLTTTTFKFWEAGFFINYIGDFLDRNLGSSLSFILSRSISLKEVLKNSIQPLKTYIKLELQKLLETLCFFYLIQKLISIIFYYWSIYLNKLLIFFLNSFSGFFLYLLIICAFLVVCITPTKLEIQIKRYSSLFCIILFLSLYIFCSYTSGLTSFYFVSFFLNWYKNILNIEYNIGLDNLGLIFLFLTLFLIPVCFLISWENINYNLKYFYILFLVLEIFLINVFSAIDLILFYIAFESILIPMYFLVGYWGSRERRMHAALQFFLYTLGGSLLMLFGLVYCQLNFGSTNLHILTEISIIPYREAILWFSFFIAFAVKIPMLPIHIWLPEAHVESATGGSVILAGILLKLGTYGVLRFLIPLFPFSSTLFTPYLYLISILGVFYGSLTTLRQIDLKKIIAYSSVIHMNYLMFGLFAFNLEGFVGSLILMVAHAFVSGGLFACIGILYDRYHTRLQKPYGSLNYFMPIFSLFFLFFTLANISFPGTINFIGEILVLFGIFNKNILIGIFLSLLMVFSTCYGLWLYNKIFSGLIILHIFFLRSSLVGSLFLILPFKRLFLTYFTDINLRECFSLTILLFPVFFLGINPCFLINYVELFFLISLTS